MDGMNVAPFSEEEVQDRVQVQVEKEEQGEGETHGKETRRGTERETHDQSTAQHG